MSDSELSEVGNLPTDAKITDCLQKVVRDGLKADEDITINVARSRAEQALGLDAGFFKNKSTWKAKSKEIIQAAVEDPISPAKSKKSAPRAKAKAGTKRKSDEAQPKKKRQKKAVTPPESDEDEGEVAAASGNEDGAKCPAPEQRARVSQTTVAEHGEDEEPEDKILARQNKADAVSYTHLTLPTKRIV